MRFVSTRAATASTLTVTATVLPFGFSAAHLCSGGSGRRPFPTVVAHMWPSDSQTLSASAPVPLASAYLGAARCSHPPRAPRRLRTGQPCGRSVTGSPLTGRFAEEASGPPSLLGIPLLRATGVHPAGSVSAIHPGARYPRLPFRRPRCCLQAAQHPRLPESSFSRLLYPRPATSLAYASPVLLLPPAQG